MKYYCNPMNLEYRYQFMRQVRSDSSEHLFSVYREAADPSLIWFKGQYYLFPSMTGGFFASEDLYDWKFHEFLQDMPVYDYAPDVRAVGEYLYFCASKLENCSFFRTKNPLTEVFEEIEGTFPFWDPNLFPDDDGRLYFYWGCSNKEPIYGVELNSETMKPLTQPLVMFNSNHKERGYERIGEDHIAPKTEEMAQQVELVLANITKEQRQEAGGMSDDALKQMLYKGMGNPYIEGPWMTKYDGRYYLQYSIPGTEYNVYGDGVYVGESPLGPFSPAENNPYSYKPSGFITGAGHGSTLKDQKGNFWHTSSMRISRNHNFERRLGLWKAGFDADGELYCDQRYGDWPAAMEKPAFEKPDWMLLSYGKDVKVSSGEGALNVTDEDIRTWWRAAANSLGEWAVVDLGNVCDVRAVQVNFADDQLKLDIPKGEKPFSYYYEERYMDNVKQNTRWLLEGSLDGDTYFTIEDKREAQTDYSHDFIVREEGIPVRYLKLTVEELPYAAIPCVSGIRVFGLGSGEAPTQAEEVKAWLDGDMDMEISWKAKDIVGANILWGYAPDKLYHSCMVYKRCSKRIGALVKGQPVYTRVDVFNENGIAEGSVIEVRK